MFFIYLLLIVISAVIFSFTGTYLLTKILPIFAIMDNPNNRSNHETATPRGGGVAIFIALIFFLAIAGIKGQIILAVLILGVISFLDDIYSLSIKVRLISHLVVSFIIVMNLDGLLFHGLIPLIFDKILAISFLIWFINLFNFMDGIDEITSIESFSICLGMAILSFMITEIPIFIASWSLIIIASIAGFWWFNRHPAKIFLGDVGSTILGLLIGYLLLILVIKGYWMQVLILPAYYLIDSGITIIRRAIFGEKIWQAHSKHAYQIAVRAGKSHIFVVRRIFLLNIFLVIMAVILTINKSHIYDIYIFIGSYIAAFSLYIYFINLRGDIITENFLKKSLSN